MYVLLLLIRTIALLLLLLCYRDDDGPVRYGTMVSIKAPSAKERYALIDVSPLLNMYTHDLNLFVWCMVH